MIAWCLLYDIWDEKTGKKGECTVEVSCGIHADYSDESTRPKLFEDFITEGKRVLLLVEFDESLPHHLPGVYDDPRQLQIETGEDCRSACQAARAIHELSDDECEFPYDIVLATKCRSDDEDLVKIIREHKVAKWSFEDVE